MGLRDRFLAKVNVDPTSGCWLWTGFIDKAGYARIREGGRKSPVLYGHRYSWEYENGTLPRGLEIDHVRSRGCTSRSCVNPEHLEAVTHRENVLRGAAPMVLLHRAGVCQNGHSLDEHAVRRKSTGQVVYCRECRRDRRRVDH